MSLVLHVAPYGSDQADGSGSSPLRTIGEAALRARPGDTVMVHAGEYREWVKPARGGTGDDRRITYTAAPGEHVVIKGSERVDTWEPWAGTVWRAELPNTLFGDFNPFAEEVMGDWLVHPDPSKPRRHLGDVYLNGTSFYEADSVEDVMAPRRRTEILDEWTGLVVPVPDPDRTVSVWHAEVSAETTTIWANFQGADPNAELVEINVRRSVFYPVEHHLDYITVRGFELAQAATPWAPPTADQPGLIGPNWAKGWIIEDNVIHDAKCSGVSIGKEISTGHNFATVRGDKPGYQYQVETVFAAARLGWDRDRVGSHVIRRNRIFECGQTGIVGHLGCVYSVIEDNHIHDIALKREFYGYEIAGIKLHAAIDVSIRHNRINDCSLGVWLDWQTQGTRVTRNICYANNRDLFVEVSHGPFVVDHNVFASPASLEVVCQGGAFVNNLICGTVRIEPVLDRATPYHLPHSTEVAGFAVITGGDLRWFRNVFLGGKVGEAYAEGTRSAEEAGFGTVGYDGYPRSMAEYLDRVSDHSLGDHERFHGQPQPVYARANVYLGGAEPFVGEVGAVVGEEPAEVRLVDDDAVLHLETDLPAGALEDRTPVVLGEELGRVRLVDAAFEEPDGRPVDLAVDLLGRRKEPGRDHPAGPIAELGPGAVRTPVW